MIRKYIVFLLILICSSIEASSNPVKEAPKHLDESFYKVSPYDIVYGKEDAPIKVLDYYSLTCPHCASFLENFFPKIKKNYIDTGKVQWIKRIYVMDPQGNDGALLLACVDENKRESYLKILLSKRSNWVSSNNYVNVLENIARLGGMSEEKFNACMKDKKTEAAIKQLALNAMKVGINGTPMFYVNQERLLIDSEKSFFIAFDKILNQASK